MKTTKAVSILFYILSVLSYLAALFMIFGIHNRPVSLFLLCVGSATLCLGGAWTNRSHNEQPDEETKNDT